MVDIQYITKLINTKLEGSDAFLVEVKLSLGKLTVFIDKPAGITIEECSALSRYLSSELEDTGFNDMHETEVSSPGMDQPLKIFQQYKRRIGKNVRVITSSGQVHTGKLLEAGENSFSILETTIVKEKKKKIKTEKNIQLNYRDVKEAKVEFKF